MKKFPKEECLGGYQDACQITKTGGGLDGQNKFQFYPPQQQKKDSLSKLEYLTFDQNGTSTF